MPNLQLGANPHAVASTLIWKYIMLVMAKLCKTISLAEVSLSCMVASSNMEHQVLFDLQIIIAGDIISKIILLLKF